MSKNQSSKAFASSLITLGISGSIDALVFQKNGRIRINNVTMVKRKRKTIDIVK